MPRWERELVGRASCPGIASPQQRAPTVRAFIQQRRCNREPVARESILFHVLTHARTHGAGWQARVACLTPSGIVRAEGVRLSDTESPPRSGARCHPHKRLKQRGTTPSIRSSETPRPSGPGRTDMPIQGRQRLDSGPHLRRDSPTSVPGLTPAPVRSAVALAHDRAAAATPR